eukprot:TRINITY_DN16130_c0_g1_i1.p1 TRINITY_DN16130_c0_g1~~TRINITY_DN16130_c0_g1_i1.p1  ORF type:complete len:125 (+),score=13.71 TRINITY_DN16130_c0_g1_i1:502-876(+)
MMSDQYIEWGSSITGEYLFGFGERNMNFRLNEGSYVIWTRDKMGDVEDGKGRMHSSYGAHPMILLREKSGNYFVLFFRNSNAQELRVEKGKITWISTGGVLHLKLFIGDQYPCLLYTSPSPRDS